MALAGVTPADLRMGWMRCAANDSNGITLESYSSSKINVCGTGVRATGKGAGSWTSTTTAGRAARGRAGAERLAAKLVETSAIFSRLPQRVQRCSSSAFQLWQYRQFMVSSAHPGDQVCYVARLGNFTRHCSFCLDNTPVPVCHEFSRTLGIFLALTFALPVSPPIAPPP